MVESHLGKVLGLEITMVKCSIFSIFILFSFPCFSGGKCNSTLRTIILKRLGKNKADIIHELKRQGWNSTPI